MSFQRLLVYAFPRAWRERYGDELEQMLEDSVWEQSIWSTSFDVVCAGLRERIRVACQAIELQRAVRRAERAGLQVLAGRTDRRWWQDGRRWAAVTLPVLLAAAISAPFVFRQSAARRASVVEVGGATSVVRCATAAVASEARTVLRAGHSDRAVVVYSVPVVCTPGAGERLGTGRVCAVAVVSAKGTVPAQRVVRELRCAPANGACTQGTIVLDPTTGKILSAVAARHVCIAATVEPAGTPSAGTLPTGTAPTGTPPTGTGPSA